MLQAATPMCAVATFLLIFKIWRTFRDPYSRPVACVQFITLSLPYLVFILLLCISVGYQLAAPSSLTAKNGVYCTALGIPFRKYSIPVFSIFIVGLMVGFEIAISVHYYRSRKLIATNFPLAHRNTSLSLIIRLTVFNVYLLITLGASANFLIGHAHSWAYIIQAPLPLLAFVLLATQRNVLLTWYFWLRKKKNLPNHSDDNIPKSRSSRTSESEIDLAYPPVHSREVASNLQTV
ncbi:hypothetical protein BJ912DRAFT_213723 [Pholiota molesta]|nr:hypothetical protein BJ912DRAFT_213723 [Pholiota molesta]